MSFAPASSLNETDISRVERFEFSGRQRVDRTVERRDGSEFRTTLKANFDLEAMEPDMASDLAWLRSTSGPKAAPGSRVIRSVDLFAGCGGLSIGIAEAARALGMDLWPVLANDIDPAILGIYSRNMPETEIVCAPVESMLDGECGTSLTTSERRLAARLGEIDLLVGGPPCQGHSDFNNHTRNNDPKNELYLRMARFCEVVRPQHVIIENVPGVERDKRQSAQRTWSILRDLGYSVDSGVTDASRLGVAQKRKRSITMASLDFAPSIKIAISSLEVKPRPVLWAISDLVDIESDRLIDQSPNPNGESRRRMDYLFDHDLYELPDDQRPDCHRLKNHSYTSVYGRLYPDRPAPTITTGFGVMGRGRFVHPTRRRTITPHEAARIQYFPDYFDFASSSRTVIQKVIGNAVPPKLGYAIGLHLLR